MPLREEISKALTRAVKAQEKHRAATLRLMIAAIKDRDIALRGHGGDLHAQDGDILEILTRMVAQRRESAQAYEDGGRPELAQQEREEIEIIQSFLPRQLEAAEMEAACEKVLQESGAQSLKDMGRVMGILKKEFAGRMDFARAGKILQARLSGKPPRQE